MERKIDLVYLWLDGNDKNWRREKDKWQAVESGKVKLAEEGTVEARWRENDELKYSLRSVAKFAPWINHIYIVTGFGQIPSWLDTKNPKITIVDHSEIMPVDALPTFNSTAIECGITNIPGLSEYFLHANDDTFFGRNLSPSYFFDDCGRTIVWYNKDRKIKSYSESFINAGSEYRSIIYNSARVIELLFGVKKYRLVPCHNIEPYRKSRIKEVLQNPLVDVYIQKTIRRKFRNKFDIQRWFFTLYDIVFGNAVTRRVRTKKRMFYHLYKVIDLFYSGFRDSPAYTTNAKKRWLNKFRPPLFCINDTQVNTKQDDIDNMEFLRNFLPEKSEFEK
ncbi:MAG: Stealth CR1 domain-containing protein [Alphaproteobacteria bacterium]|nr:Stealth CR1 domain-containing protein [Alphaproteobacteria bacterium]